ESRAVGEIENGAREARQLVVRLPELPIAIHAKVRMKNSSIVEMEQLMLSSSFHALDTHTGERAETRWRETSLEGGVQELETGDSASLRSPAQHIHGCFDFGKLGHWTL
ncbi:MAG: hypothetical protein JWL61_4805, partial [Gemmatimonadetes bacterium]|nr:hypothetical protein [Gemmatimonadota bacterium]